MIARARERRRGGRPTIFFLDEIHRFNKAQQDALLPGGRGGARDARRRDDREPVLRGQLGAALPHAGLRAARADRRGRRGAAAARARRAANAATAAVDDDAIAFLAARSGGDARTALNALELACETAARAATAAASRSPTPRTRCSARRCSTTRTATSTTTSSRPGSSRRAARTPTRRSTTSRRCSRAARTRASSRGGWSSSPPRTSATPTRRRSPVAVAAAHAVEHVGLPECQFALAQAAIYLSLAPKSNAAKRAIIGARAHIARARLRSRAPDPLRSAAFPAARRDSAAGSATRTRTTSPGHVNDQEHLPRRPRGPALLRPRRRRAGAARAPRGAAPRARARAMSALYDRIGRSYVATRAEDPRIAAAIHAALGDCAHGRSTSAPEPARTSRATATSPPSSRPR